jgi:PAS domain S-box-containing protein
VLSGDDNMTERQWLRVLLAAVTVDVGIDVLHDVPFINDQFGSPGEQRWMSVLEGGTHILAAVALLAIGRAAVKARKQRFHDRQVLEVTVSASSDWLWETDADNRYTYCSPGVEDLLGHSSADMLGWPLDRFVAENDAARVMAATRSCKAAGIPLRDVEAVWQHRQGHPVVLRGSVSPIFDEHGRAVGLRGSRRLVVEGADPYKVERARVSEAISSGGVRVALQPIVGLPDGQIAGVEALARFDDGRGPDVWFREARVTGQGIELERMTFAMALAHFHDMPEGVYLSVNASPELVSDPSFGAELIKVHGTHLSRLVIEITEHESISDYTAVNEALRPLREMGCRVAVDDAGAGYASLIHVLELLPDIIKIDKELLAGLDRDRARRSLVTALVLLALDLGATVTAEGVETAEELAVLGLLGVDCAQGYFLARPTADVEQWLGWWTREWNGGRHQDESATRRAALNVRDSSNRGVGPPGRRGTNYRAN